MVAAGTLPSGIRQQFSQSTHLSYSPVNLSTLMVNVVDGQLEYRICQSQVLVLCSLPSRLDGRRQQMSKRRRHARAFLRLGRGEYLLFWHRSEECRTKTARTRSLSEGATPLVTPMLLLACFVVRGELWLQAGTD